MERWVRVAGLALGALVGAAIQGCRDAPRSLGNGGFGGGWPARPVIVEPRVETPRVDTATIARVTVAPVELKPPVVRGVPQVDTFQQDAAKVDVLWIIDNSGSLNDERMRLAARFDRFLRVLDAASIDYHVGVTSTDLDRTTGDQGRLRGSPSVITPATQGAPAVFRRAVDFPPSNVTLEEGLRALFVALSEPTRSGANAGFLRDDAALAVIVLSDEDDGSIGPSAFFSRFLRGLKGPGRETNVSFSAVAGPLPDGCVPAGEERVFGAKAEPARRYREVVDATGGLFASICTADFSSFVEQLATRLGALRRVFQLTAPPVLETLVVRVNGREVPRDPVRGYTFRGADRTIVFDGSFVPPPGARIEVDYDVAN